MSAADQWGFHDILRDDVDAWVSRKQHEARELGQSIPGAVFRGRLATRLGVTLQVLDAWCAGEAMPDADKLAILTREIETARAVRHLAEQCGVGTYDLVPLGEVTLSDRARQAIRILREVTDALASAAQAATDEAISVVEHRALQREKEAAVEALQKLEPVLRERMEAGLRR